MKGLFRPLDTEKLYMETDERGNVKVNWIDIEINEIFLEMILPLLFIRMNAKKRLNFVTLQ